MVHRYDVAINNDGGSQKKMVMMIMGRYQKFWGPENFRGGIML